MKHSDIKVPDFDEVNKEVHLLLLLSLSLIYTVGILMRDSPLLKEKGIKNFQLLEVIMAHNATYFSEKDITKMAEISSDIINIQGSAKHSGEDVFPFGLLFHFIGKNTIPYTWSQIDERPDVNIPYQNFRGHVLQLIPFVGMLIKGNFTFQKAKELKDELPQVPKTF